jgi:Ca2+-binding RTX toxin-like protein
MPEETPPPEPNPPSHATLATSFRLLGMTLSQGGAAIAAGGIPTIPPAVRAALGNTMQGVGNAFEAQATVLGAPSTPTSQGQAGLTEADIQLMGRTCASIIATAIIAEAIPLAAAAATFLTVSEGLITTLVIVGIAPEIATAIIATALFTLTVWGMSEFGGAAFDAINWVINLFGSLLDPRDPIALDLNNDGFTLTSLAGSEVHFDLDGNGFAEQTGWISPPDGLLARDVNANGTIDDIGELFGSQTQNGFDMLAALDDNADGLISAVDSGFSTLVVWRDSDQDGATDSGEIASLSSLGIASIGTVATGVHEPNAGNLITHRSTFTYGNGTSGATAAIQFTSNPVNTQYSLPAGFAYDPDVFELPNLRGYGRVPDLWVAMSLDPELKGMVQDLVARGATIEGFADIIGGPVAGGLDTTPGTGAPTLAAYLNDDFENMLYRWANVVPRPAEDNFTAESFTDGTGRGWSSGMTAGVNTVYGTISAFLDRVIPDFAFVDPRFYDAFKQFSTNMAARFYAQVAIQPELDAYEAFAEAARLNPPAGASYTAAETEAFMVAFDAALQAGPALSPHLSGFRDLWFDFGKDSLGGDSSALLDEMFAGFSYDPADPWDGYDGLRETHRYLAEAIAPGEGVLRTRLRLVTGNTALDIERDEHHRVVGTPGDDGLTGDTGTSHQDLLIGGPGDDVLHGATGSDTYVFSGGSGSDVILDTGGDGDEVAFQGSLASTIARFGFANGNAQDLTISFQGRTESVTIQGYFTSTGAATLERMTFSDGLEMSHQAVRDGVYAGLATAGDDILVAFPLSTTVIGLAGNDVLSGQSGDDVLDGGVGSDLLQGGVGNDTYRFAAGYGQDIVRDAISGWNSGGADTVAFGSGITVDDVQVLQADNGNDLVLVLNSGDQVTLDGTLADAGYRIERVLFADGRAWTHSDLMARATQPTDGNDLFYGGYDADILGGGAGNDTLIGNGDADTLTGGGGNDLLQGGLGSDTYVFNAGDGQDIVRDLISGWNSGGFDTVELGTGITPTGVTVVQSDNGNDLILQIGATTQITLDQTVAESGARIERVRFADGTIWDHSALMALATTPTAGNDAFYGGYDADALSGGGGNDTLVGNDGNDALTGGSGNDLLQGGAGNDSYMFAPGDGQDTIREALSGWNSGGNDWIQLAAGITPGAVTVSQGDSGNDLIIKIGATDQITLDQAIADGNSRIEEIRFADGTVWTHGFLLEKSSGGTPGADTLSGDWGPNVLSGGAGNDTLRGNEGNDTLIGGTGNDLVQGGLGNDTYVFAAGDGQDIVRDSISGWNSGGSDTLRFEAGITAGSVVVVQADSGNDFVLKIGATDQITLDQAVSDWNSRIEETRFADGTTWTYAQLLANATTPTAGDDTFYGSTDAETLSGGAGNDRLLGNDGGDTLIGGTGNDVLQGGLGNDTYFFAAGDGHDIVRDAVSGWNTGGFDILQFSAGISAAGVLVYQADNGNDFVLKIGATDQVTLDQAVNDGNSRIEEVRFVDGNVVWTYADLLTGAWSGKSTGDTYWGDTAANTISGGDSADMLWGRAGDDTLNGDAGDDTINGEDGVDQLYGGDGNDTLSGGNGNDGLYGGADADSLTGGAGNDTLDGGTGVDNAKFAGLKSSYSLTTTGGSTQIVDNAPTADGNDGTDQIVGVETLIFKNGETISLSAPIVLDLDGDGIELADLGAAKAAFDWNSDGLRDSTGWIGKGDGLLVYDRNGDGRVSGPQELSFLNDAPGARSDLEGLRAFDTNGDGSFSGRDAQWRRFHVWRDRDGDGVIDKGELLSMRRAGVASISLEATPTEQSWAWGENPVMNYGHFTRTNGSLGALADVAMTYSASVSVELAHAASPEAFSAHPKILSAGAMFLPLPQMEHLAAVAEFGA